MSRKLALLLLLCLAPTLAQAADLAKCSSTGRDYRTKPVQRCYILCSGVGTGSGTKCGPGTLPMLTTKHYTNLIVGFGNADTACTTGAFKIQWCATASCDPPRLPQTFVTLTGVGDTDLSSQGFSTPPGSIYQAQFPAIGDSDCDANGGIDVFLLIDETD